MQVIENYSSPYFRHIIDLPASIVRKLWKKNQITLVDVRTPEEYEDHHIPGALLIPLDYLEILSKYIQDKEIAVVCEHGNRSRYATYGMPHLYKKKTINMLGGMMSWISMGYEIESGIDENGIKWQEWLDKEINQ
ncbi:rhodanese-like domain-containing protein [Acidianus brierleyi]|uniref:Rhodanese n=1 Tax=Acidianus brierleyi TaxID=41673 RepID=A0A2U9IBU7_9CREN|nr:rhodanese-like domain-containing protein [Acidianus brierleyi]AWR93506.1 rhodanese-like domain-containing protein [Acidianus brierleyi]